MPLRVFWECAALNEQNSPAGWTVRFPGGPRPPVDLASRPGGFSLSSGGADVDALADAVPRGGPSLEDTVWRKSRWLVTVSHVREPSSGRRRVSIVLAIPQSRQKMCSGLEEETQERRTRGRRNGKEGGEIRLASSKKQKGKKRGKKGENVSIVCDSLRASDARTSPDLFLFLLLFVFSLPRFWTLYAHMEWVCGKILLSESVCSLRNVFLTLFSFFALQNSCCIGKNISVTFYDQVKTYKECRRERGRWHLKNLDVS